MDAVSKQIVLKIARSSLPEAKKLVADLLRQALPEAEAKRASVEPVFPDVKAGRRAGMLILSLGARTSPEAVEKVIGALRGAEGVEYAQPAAARTAVGAGTKRS